MTKTFERFLGSFSDEELVRFAVDRGTARPPYWRMMRLALQIEAGRRGLQLDTDLLGPAVAGDPEAPSRTSRRATGRIAAGSVTPGHEGQPRPSLDGPTRPPGRCVIEAMR